MTSELIKLFSPIFIFILWLKFSFRVRSKSLKGAGLFFASLASCSSNFSFIYRELHQVIQSGMIIYFLIYFYSSQRIFRINLILGTFLTFIGISLVVMPFDEDAKSQLINYIVIIGVINFICISIQSRKNFECLMIFIADIAILLAVIGVFEYFFNSGRIEVTFANPNYYGLFLGVGICLVSFYWTGWRKSIGIILLLIPIVLCGSRSSLAFPIFLYLWIIYRQGKIIKSIPIALAGVIIVFIISSLGITRFSDTEATEDSDGERIAFTQIALRMANDHPLAGVGWGRFINEFKNYSSAAEAIEVAHGVIDVSKQERRVTHNDFLRILAELGWVACAFSILCVFYGIKLILFEKGFGFDFLPPVWIGTVFFSIAHNNMNSAFMWFFFILPFFIDTTYKKYKK